MGLSMEKKVFTVEYYYRTYINGYQGGSSLKLVAEQYREHFNKPAPGNTVMLSIITKFCHKGSVLCQRKGKSGRPVAVSTNENHGCVINQVMRHQTEIFDEHPCN